MSRRSSREKEIADKTELIPRSKLGGYRGKPSGKQRGRQSGKQVDVPRRSWVMDVAILMVLGATLLPWASDGSAGLNGIGTGAGKLVAAIAFVGFMLPFVTITGKLTKLVNALEMVLPILAGAICAYHMLQVHAGIGEWVGLVASIFWAGTAFISIRQSLVKEKH